jgi:hypothetical protein
MNYTNINKNIIIITIIKTHNNFLDALDYNPLSIDFINSNMIGVRTNTGLNTKITKGNIKFTNVIFPNGTWSISKSNFILNGDTEENLSLLFFESLLILFFSSVRIC